MSFLFFFFFLLLFIYLFIYFFCSEFCHTLKWNVLEFTCRPVTSPEMMRGRHVHCKFFPKKFFLLTSSSQHFYCLQGGLKVVQPIFNLFIKVQFTQEQLFSQTHHASSTQAQNRHWVLRSPLLLLSWYCSPKRQPFSWLLIACFTLKHNFTWINSNSLCIQLTNNANLKTCSIYNV